MKLNLGCGQPTKDGYVNIDLYETYSKKGHEIVKMDASKLDYEDGTIDEIWNRDLFEHIEWEKALDTLKEWHRVLRKGGLLQIKTPAIDLVIQELNTSGIDTPEYRRMLTLLHGCHRLKGHDHKNGTTKNLLERQLNFVGFNHINTEIIYPDLTLFVRAIK